MLKQRVKLKLAQRLALTPKMREALYILQLPLMELKKFLQEKMTENPLLEEAEEVIDEFMIPGTRITARVMLRQGMFGFAFR